MTILMREIQQVRPGKWAELEKAEARWVAFERRLGYPQNKRRYRVYSGVENTHTIVIEYEWESLAALEAASRQCEADPEYQELIAELDSLIESNRVELYTVLS